MSDGNKLRTDHFATVARFFSCGNNRVDQCAEKDAIDETIAAIKAAQHEAQEAYDEAVRAFEEASNPEQPLDDDADAEGGKGKEEPEALEEPVRVIPQHLAK